MRFLRAQIALELRSFSRHLRFLPGVMAIYGTLSRDNAPLNELNRYELNGPHSASKAAGLTFGSNIVRRNLSQRGHV